MLKKLMIRTWRGPLPSWTPQFMSSVEPLKAFGWKFVIMPWDLFRGIVETDIKIRIPYDIDTRKPGDYDPALGDILSVSNMYDIHQDDFWGHFNLDCVYGRLSHFLPDSFLANIDIYGNDPGAVCGPFTIYRNCERVNRLYRDVFDWKDDFQSPTFLGWDEGRFSTHVRGAALRGEIRFTSGFLQAHDHMTVEHQRHAQIPDDKGIIAPVRFDGPCLIDNVTGQEIMMYHFNQTRRWPVG